MDRPKEGGNTMPKRIDQQELTEILKVIQQQEQGMGLAKIAEALFHSIPRNRLMRRINQMILLGSIEAIGAGKATRYRAVLPSSATTPASTPEEGEAYGRVPLSPEALEVVRRVRAPVQARKPVGYDRSFLASYEPNRTRYVPEDISQKLLALGSVVSPSAPRPAGTYARQILDRLLIDLSWNSSRLEGNTYSLLDTKKLLAEGVGRDGDGGAEAQMILNHKAAIEFMVDGAEDIGMNAYTLKNLHALLANNLLTTSEDCGRLRTSIIGIEGSVYIPLSVPQQIEEFFSLLVAKAHQIGDPFEQAFFVMVHVPYLQPFVDGNKRTSRLAANVPFIERNLCPLSFLDVPERSYIDAILAVYELRHVAPLLEIFAWTYERSALRYRAIRQSLGSPDPFRLKYRQALIDVIGAIVRAPTQAPWSQSGPALVKELAGENVAPQDLGLFTEVVSEELAGLHEGNIARYRLRPSEYEAFAAARACVTQN